MHKKNVVACRITPQGDGWREETRTFGTMIPDLLTLADWLRGHGVARGDQVLVMLNNELALWESMLACIKLGAVLIPCSSLLTPTDLGDRMQRGEVKHVIVGAANAEKFSGLAGSYTRVCVGAASRGWHSPTWRILGPSCPC